MKILLTGANGYIGRRLLPLLVQAGHRVVCLVRDVDRIDLEEDLRAKVSLVEADLLKPDTLESLPTDIDVAYYLVHSMGKTSTDFTKLEKACAENFQSYLVNTTVKQVIYLGGISNDGGLSKHLTSRKNVETYLQSSHYTLTVLRAPIIIGSGSASFEIIRDLVEKLPVMIAPKWLQTKCQPIAIRNVLEYLKGVALNEGTYDKIFDIGGPESLTYKEMLLKFGEVRGLKRWIFTVPVLTPKLSSLWLYFVTSTSFGLARSLVDSMRNEVVVKTGEIRAYVPVELIQYDHAVNLAFNKIAQNEVISSWKDSFVASADDLQRSQYIQVPKYGCFVDKKVRKVPAEDIPRIVQNIWSIGGERGWYFWGFLWKVRGYMDKLVGGVGLRRGRRDPFHLVAGDALDFWRVLLADREERRLLLLAEMKLPGEAWLEFHIRKTKDGYFLVQNATFRPQGIMGRLYWYSVLPFHLFIFNGMINRLIAYRPA